MSFKFYIPNSPLPCTSLHTSIRTSPMTAWLIYRLIQHAVCGIYSGVGMSFTFMSAYYIAAVCSKCKAIISNGEEQVSFIRLVPSVAVSPTPFRSCHLPALKSQLLYIAETSLPADFFPFYHPCNAYLAA